MNRRDFCKTLGTGLCLACTGPALDGVIYADRARAGTGAPIATTEVPFYTNLSDNAVQCGICPRNCRIDDGERGFCGNKENREGIFQSLVHSRVCAMHVDPIEKKPFFHYLPDTRTLSIAAAGCNFRCRFCQNWRIAQVRPEQIESIHRSPDSLVADCVERSIPTIACTYTEPVVFYGYMLDCALAAREQGISSVMVSNGSINETPLRRLCQSLSAVKIDLKSFNDEFYRRQCSGRLQPVLNTLLTLKDIGIWFEIVVLIIPTLNDSSTETARMCAWLYKNLGPDVPLHFTRFHPMYKIRNLPPTPIATLEACHRIARDAGLHFVYIGNIPGHSSQSTLCPGCGEKLIRRIGFTVMFNKIQDGCCSSCGRAIPGVWKHPHLPDAAAAHRHRSHPDRSEPAA